MPSYSSFSCRCHQSKWGAGAGLDQSGNSRLVVVGSLHGMVDVCGSWGYQNPDSSKQLSVLNFTSYCCPCTGGWRVRLQGLELIFSPNLRRENTVARPALCAASIETKIFGVSAPSIVITIIAHSIETILILNSVLPLSQKTEEQSAVVL